MSDPIPQTDPRAGYLERKAEIDAAVARVLSGGWYILGKEVAAFEQEFAAWCGNAHGIGVANGTDALVLALRGLGVGAGDMVATVSHTAVATVAAVELAGATPILIDIEADTYCMDPAALEAAFAREGGRIKVVVPVHLYGHPADMGAIAAIARKHGAHLLEDCSQAHGATIGGRRVGGFGDVAAFSLYPTKNLGALGDGGVITTDDGDLARRIRELREYGWRERYISAVAGMNSRLDELQAGILRAKLPFLDGDNARRRAAAAVYDRELANSGLVLPTVRAGTEHVYHQYVVRHPDREGLRQRLKDQGITTNVHYPAPVHMQPAYQGRTPVGPGGMAQTEKAQGEILSLPMFPQLSTEAASRVAAAIRGAMRDRP
ncbi:MAG: DegT/DnrJ/EryC1/StrS family aminotransferase [Alphaproteobacteria bacterium]